MSDLLPLADTLVVDATRMLPGAVLSRSLIDLGARVLKIEAPAGGDPMRHMPPHADGIGVGFCLYYRGAESVTLDLRTPEGMDRLRALLGRADVFTESFRPGTLARWGLELDAVEASNPGLVSCTLPGFAAGNPRVAHDLNLTALTGFVQRLPGGGFAPGSSTEPARIPPVQIADVNAGLLASGSVLAALLRRTRTGRGARLAQPLLSGPLPFVAWPWADAAMGARGVADTLLGGDVPCYRVYEAADGALAVGALEPKFWVGLCQVLGHPELAAAGLDASPRGQEAAETIQTLLRTQPVQHWLDLFEDHNLPVTAVHDMESAIADPTVAASGLLERLPLPGGETLQVPGPAHASLTETPDRPAPRLGADTERVLAEFGL
jgi:crotonobetainyl-CoA:carnitine CoA-transferase CaiB-like acyl-CoA transferase